MSNTTASPTPQPADDKRNRLREAALAYHEFPTPGKFVVNVT